MSCRLIYKRFYMITIQDNEYLVTVARKHWFTYAGLCIGHGTLFVFAVILLFFVQGSLAYGAILSFLWLVSTSFTWFFVIQYLDRWYIVNTHIVATDQIELFSRSESNILFSKIQDVKWNRNGILEEFFGYGTLSIQSAGVEQIFTMKDVAGVEEIAKKIFELKASATSTPV